MNPEKNREFENNMNQLMRVLKKLLKNLPGQPPFPPFQGKSPEGGVNLNLCFFTFLPMSPEDYEAFEEAYEQSLHEERADDFVPELTPSDVEFLRRNGIRF